MYYRKLLAQPTLMIYQHLGQVAWLHQTRGKSIAPQLTGKTYLQ